MGRKEERRLFSELLLICVWKGWRPQFVAIRNTTCSCRSCSDFRWIFHLGGNYYQALPFVRGDTGVQFIIIQYSEHIIQHSKHVEKINNLFLRKKSVLSI